MRGDRLQKRRNEMKLSQDGLSLKTGISQPQISKYERGLEKEITAGNLIALARALNVSTDWLLGLTDESGQQSEYVPQAE